MNVSKRVWFLNCNDPNEPLPIIRKANLTKFKAVADKLMNFNYKLNAFEPQAAKWMKIFEFPLQNRADLYHKSRPTTITNINSLNT